jgi:hypothetical protein
MKPGICMRANFGTRGVLFMFAVATALCVQTAGGEEVHKSQTASDAAEIQPHSVLEESFRYHRLGEAQEKVAHPTIAPGGGWYRYGFPVQTRRWGWFGAEHYYPRVLWHRGYYGDRCRWAYRRGY